MDTVAVCIRNVRKDEPRYTGSRVRTMSPPGSTRSAAQGRSSSVCAVASGLPGRATSCSCPREPLSRGCRRHPGCWVCAFSDPEQHCFSTLNSNEASGARYAFSVSRFIHIFLPRGFWDLRSKLMQVFVDSRYSRRI